MENLASNALNKKDYELAGKLYLQLVQKNPDDVETLENLAKCLRYTNNLDEARHFAEKALTIDPNRYLPYITLASINHLQGGDNLSTYQFAEKAYQIAPGMIDSLGCFGWASMLIGQHEQGVRFLEHAAKLAPNDYDIHLNLLLGYTQLQNPEQTFSAAKRAVRIKPTIVSVYWLYASFINRKLIRVIAPGMFFGGIIGAILLHMPILLLIPFMDMLGGVLSIIYLIHLRFFRRSVVLIIYDVLFSLLLIFLWKILSS
jgi:tetratricopeptide (TPR) repeat protein